MGAWRYFTTNELKPQGWLRRQLEIQAAGLSGNLDKVWPDVRDSAWIGGSREGWERVPYWLDGFIPLAYLLEDGDMIARAKKYINAILERQQPDGWICPCMMEERSRYDSWAVQLISKVLTVYYECSGDARIPDVLYRLLKNYYDLLQNGTVKLFDWGKFRWFEAMIAISSVYERCGESWLKELASILREQGSDYTQFVGLWERPMNCWRFDTHIVNIAMMLKSEAVSHELLGEAYTDRAEYLHRILDKYNGTVYGSYTGDECLSGLSAVQGTELCAIVEQMYSCEHLFAHTGESKWLERLEVLAFNALPAAISDDMWTHQYDQMSNQIACQRFPGKPIFRTNDSDAHLFGLEPHYGCCTANFNQGWPKLALSTFAHQGETVVSTLMLPSKLHTEAADITLETNYPFENSAKYTVDAKKEFNFVIRIPSFAEYVAVNGEPFEGQELSFAVVPGTSVIEIEFHTQPRFVQRPNNLHAVRCGSLLFSLPIAYDKRMLEYERGGVERKFPYCDYELIPTSDWGYGYCGRELTVQRKAPGPVPFSGEDPAVTVKTHAVRIDWGYADGYDTVCAKIPESIVPLSEPEEVILHPYGGAKLRLTELPIVK